jgi:DNA-binding transcriptional LysR family regulator
VFYLATRSSQLIAELESVVGFRIFARMTRTVALSPAGTHRCVAAAWVMP